MSNKRKFNLDVILHGESSGFVEMDEAEVSAYCKDQTEKTGILHEWQPYFDGKMAIKTLTKEKAAELKQQQRAEDRIVRAALCVGACKGIDSTFLRAWNHAVKTNNGTPWDRRIDAMLSQIQALKNERDDLGSKLAISEAMYQSGCHAEEQRDELLSALRIADLNLSQKKVYVPAVKAALKKHGVQQ